MKKYKKFYKQKILPGENGKKQRAEYFYANNWGDLSHRKVMVRPQGQNGALKMKMGALKMKMGALNLWEPSKSIFKTLNAFLGHFRGRKSKNRSRFVISG